MPWWRNFAFDSSARSIFFIPRPAEKPPSVPAEPMIRCQGTIIGRGFAAMAWPTARAAFGFLALIAIQA
jgi:hypothetical protein